MKGISGVVFLACAHPVSRRDGWDGNGLVMLDSTVAEAMHG
jgi:hypothetical protein